MRDGTKRLLATALDTTATACVPGALVAVEEQAIGFVCIAIAAACVFAIRVARSSWPEIERHRVLSIEWIAAFVAASAILGAAVASDGKFEEPFLLVPPAVAMVRLGFERSVRRTLIASCALGVPIALSIAVLEGVIEPRSELGEVVERIEDGSGWEGCWRIETASWWIDGAVDEERLAAAKAACLERSDSQFAAYERRLAIEAQSAALRTKGEAEKAAWIETDWPSAVLRILREADDQDAAVTPPQFYAAWIRATSLQRIQISEALSDLRLVWNGKVEDVAESRDYSGRQSRRDGWTLEAKAECPPDYELCGFYVACRFPETASAVLAGVAKEEPVQLEGAFQRAVLHASGELHVQFSECKLL